MTRAAAATRTDDPARATEKTPIVVSPIDAFERLQDKGEVLVAYAEKKPEGSVEVRRNEIGRREFDAVRRQEWSKERPTKEEFIEYAKGCDKELRAPVYVDGPKYYREAGFESAGEWLEDLKHCGSLPEEVYVYRIKRTYQENPATEEGEVEVEDVSPWIIILYIAIIAATALFLATGGST